MGRGINSEERVKPGTSAPRASMQFSIAAIMWTTFTLAVVLGYLRTFGLYAAMLGAAVLLTSALTAVLVGSIARQLREAVYWATLGAAFAIVCVTGLQNVDPVMRIGWGMTGGLTGAVAGAVAAMKQNQPGWSILAGAVTGTLVIAGFCLFSGLYQLEVIIDIVAAAFVSAGLAAVIEVIRWVESRHTTPRYITAAGLITAVVAGNLSAGWMMP